MSPAGHPIGGITSLVQAWGGTQRAAVPPGGSPLARDSRVCLLGVDGTPLRSASVWCCPPPGGWGRRASGVSHGARVQLVPGGASQGSVFAAWRGLAWRPAGTCPWHTSPARGGAGPRPCDRVCVPRMWACTLPGPVPPCAHSVSPLQFRELSQQCRCRQQQIHIWPEHE